MHPPLRLLTRASPSDGHQGRHGELHVHHAAQRAADGERSPEPHLKARLPGAVDGAAAGARLKVHARRFPRHQR